MRRSIDLNPGWLFIGEDGHCEEIDVPHTWNALDGQDGGNDYVRGSFLYQRTFSLPCPTGVCYLEFDGVNASCSVRVNDHLAGTHAGGYSRFRFDITAFLLEDAENVVEVEVDNGINETVYPQTADFTFYGGIYRSVRLICLGETHFDMDDDGSCGVKITAQVAGTVGTVAVELSALVAPSRSACTLVCEIRDMSRTIVATSRSTMVESGVVEHDLQVEDMILWDGLENPYLYTLTATLLEEGVAVDTVSQRFGFRTFELDSEQGCLLNGRSYPLRGVSRHQDVEGRGNALEREDHIRDLELILECGANAVRLAHYQQSQEFYDLCDEKGLAVWAEIPYISRHMEGGRENTLSQMRELVKQNHHHPSIVCWGLSNEITASGISEGLIENNRALHDLCHSLDETRPTVMAHAFMLSPQSPILAIPDLIGYNLYYGWYLGETGENGVFLDDLHAAYPDTPIALSEYGADALVTLQSDAPVRGDFSESYQTVYHEQMCRLISERPYLWGTFLWNMFDFGADAREIGTSRGKNCKGLVTFDRKTRKDSFYVFKAFFSTEPFLHIAGSRFVYRNKERDIITVYSNQRSVTLFNNGACVGSVEADKVFEFEVEFAERNLLEAVSGTLKESIELFRTDEGQPQYSVSSHSDVSNWLSDLELSPSDTHFTVFDTVEDILAQEGGLEVIETIMKMREGAKEGISAEVVIEPTMMMRLIKDSTVETLLKQFSFEPSKIIEVNGMLAALPKER